MPSRIHDLVYSTKPSELHLDEQKQRWDAVVAWREAGCPARIVEPDDGDLDLSFTEPVENLDLLDDLPDFSGPLDGSKKVTTTAPETPSKKVRKRFRRSDRNDKEALEKIQAFVVTPDMPYNPALVAILNPSHSPSIVRCSPTRRPSNDNQLPDYEKSGDLLKLVMANEALEATGRPAVSWSLNLSPERREAALSHPKGFADYMARKLTPALQRHLGYVPLYWFGIGIDKKGRLHLHGGIAAHPHELDRIAAALKAAAGKISDTTADFHQLDMNPQCCDLGWVQYVWRQARKAQKSVKGRVFTITNPLRVEAEELYGNCRDIMRHFG